MTNDTKTARSFITIALALASAGCGGDLWSDELSAAESALSPSFILKGRLAIADAYDCTGGTASVGMSWSSCHRFKSHFQAASGLPIASDSHVAGALRPLSASVTAVYQSWPDGAVCDVRTFQTDTGGFFTSPLVKCTSSGEGVVSLTVQLRYQATAPDSALPALGTIRALWAREEIPQVYLADDANVVHSSTNVSGVTSHYIIPTFSTRAFVSVPADNQTLDIGNQVVAGEEFGAPYLPYLRGALAAWQNLVAIHAKAREALRDGSSTTPYADYSRLFLTSPATACTGCYSLRFTLPGQFGGGVGGGGGMSTAAPLANITEDQVAALSAAGLFAHEFGHGINESLAPTSMVFDDFFHAGARNPDGSEYGISHQRFVPVTSDVFQQQETGEAMVEGFANSMARFLLLDGCDGNNPLFDSVGSQDMRANMWNPTHYRSCDGSPFSGCPFHNFRRQMNVRGIAEGSVEWNRRLDALTKLASDAAAGGMRRVLSTNESKTAQFFCKLLGRRPDYSSMAGQVVGRRYLDDYLYLVGEIVDGRSPPLRWRRYSQDVTTARARVTLRTLLQAMSQVCSDCNNIPSPLPQPLWQFPALSDGANAEYNARRLSIHGMLSPQNLARILVNRGSVSKGQINNLLRATFMEEIE
jgi:hypothetical protein